MSMSINGTREFKIWKETFAGLRLFFFDNLFNFKLYPGGKESSNSGCTGQ